MREATEDKDTIRQTKGSWLDSPGIAFSMYSRFPVPQVQWTEAGMKYAICFFPLVGVAVGGCVAVFAFLARHFFMGRIGFAGFGTALPILLTGGIHMDGFLDTVDARSSCQSRERKLEILKDPHIGAFAIIGCGVYLLLYVSAFSGLGEGAFPAVLAVYVMPRALSGWALVGFPKAKREGLASTFARQASDQAVEWCMAGWFCLAAGFLAVTAGILAGCCMTVVALVIFWWYHHMAMKEFGGITGDLAGYFLQLAELGMVAVLAGFC